MPLPSLPTSFHAMVKPRGALCNLGCQYCYFLKKEQLYPGSDLHMADETLEQFTRQYIEGQAAPVVTFAWQGGEPTLMGLAFFQRAVELQQLYGRPGVRIENAFQTNGTLLDEAWCRFFKQQGFLVGISLDGPQALHDAYRVDKGGAPTWERVMDGVRLLQQHGVAFNILTTVHRANAPHPVEVYRFLRDQVGAEFIQFIPIVERANESGFQEGFQVKKHSVTAKQWGEFLTGVFDEWLKRDVGKVFVQHFDLSLAAWMGERTGLCVHEPTCGRAVAVEHNGDVYACDHFVEPLFRLGNLFEMELAQLLALPRQVAFGEDKRRKLPRFCRECEVRFVCNGGCPKDRIRRTPDGEAGLNYLCTGYKAFFTHIDRPMRAMASLLRAGRPAAEVMGKFTLNQEKQ